MARTSWTGRFGAEASRLLQRADAVGGLTVAAGSFSVVVTSLFYLLSAPDAVAPVLVPLPDAAAAAVRSAATMRIAGTSGVFGNLVMAIGCLLLAIERVRTDRPISAAGWAACVMSIVVFEVVDALTGFVLAPAASDPAGPAAFHAFRNLYAVFFLVGTAFFGLGAVLILLEADEARVAGRWLALAGVLNGALGLIAVVATLFGWPLGQAVGASVTIGAVLFVAIGLRIATGTIPKDAPRVPAQTKRRMLVET